MMNRVLEVLEARAAVAAALEDQSHHRIVVESTGVLAMTAVDHEGHGPDEALAGFRAAPACTIDAGHHLALKKVVERLDRKSTRLNSSHSCATRMPSSA